MKRILLLAFLLLGAYITFADSTAITSRDIMNTMVSRISAAKTLKFTLKSWERMNGKDVFNDVDCKLSVSPLKLYLLSKAEPNKGVEILYNEAIWGKKAKVNPGKMLPNVTLDPYGKQMRKDQHHTILNSGFSFLGQIISRAVKKADTEAPGQFETLFKYEGEFVWQNRTCYKVTITDPTFKYVDYVVKAGESIASLEQKNHICGYLIVEKNKDVVPDVFSLKEGMKIKIPTSYAKKTTLLIDKQTYMPIVQTMFDDIGQFERYEFHNVVVNPSFAENEFTTEFSGYKF
ncbi:MAG: DUF1571 domain-containing protein [Chitinophagales bacterium]|nr:DUF1571 domain-containing protein [Chitinophagales bacterium]